MASSQMAISFPAMGFGPVYSAKHEFPSVEQASNTIFKCLVTPIIFMINYISVPVLSGTEFMAR